MTNTGKPERVDLPEYRPASFHALWRLLGENDAALEWIEVAIRQLLQQQRDGGTDAVQALASAHGVRVQDLDQKSVRCQWAKLQIGAAARYLEVFLDDFRADLPRKGRVRDSKDDLVSYTLDVYKVKKSDVGDLQVDLLSYYRKVRNRFTHDPAAEEPRKLAREAERLREVVRSGESPYRHLDAPNASDAVCFDDFILLTRAIKDFAKALCTAVQISEEEIKQHLLGDNRLISALRRQNEPQRRKELLANYIRQSFGFSRTADSMAEGLLLQGLLA
jgi:hypothetical protein